MPAIIKTQSILLHPFVHRAHGFTDIRVTIKRRALDRHTSTPLNLSYNSSLNMDGYDEGLADLEFEVSFGSSGSDVYMREIEYRDIYRVTERRAAVMATTIKRIAAKVRKSEAVEAGDVFMAFGKAVGADGACYSDDYGKVSSMADMKWRYLTLAEGREYLRRLVRETVKPKVPANA